MTSSRSERIELAEWLLRLREQCSAEVTEALWTSRENCFGTTAGGKDRCRQDLGLHVQFLAGAVQAGAPALFRDYTVWCTRVLTARGILEPAIHRSFDLVLAWLKRSLPADQGPQLDAFLEEVSKARSQEALAKPVISESVRRTRESYVAALLAADRRAALAIVEESLRSVPLVEIYVDVLAASLHEIGKMWENNRITVAQEHIATAITQMVVSTLYAKIPAAERNRGKMIVTGVSGEMHQVGPNLLADAMEAGGWHVRFLGSNVPAKAILQEVVTLSPDVVCISTTLVSNLPLAASIVHQIHDLFGEERPRIFVGGAAFNCAPEPFLKELGVVRADLRRALQILCPTGGELTAGSPDAGNLILFGTGYLSR